MGVYGAYDWKRCRNCSKYIPQIRQGDEGICMKLLERGINDYLPPTAKCIFNF